MIEHSGQVLVSIELDASLSLAFITSSAILIVLFISSIQIFKRKEYYEGANVN